MTDLATGLTLSQARREVAAQAARAASTKVAAPAVKLPGPMHAIWIEEDDPLIAPVAGADFNTYRSRGIDRIYVDIRPGYDAVNRVVRIRDAGFTAGVYWGANWGEMNYVPDQFAQYVSDLISDMERQWAQQHKGAQCEFQFDFEFHNSAYMEAWIPAWRKLRPAKVTSWTLESWQGGPYTWMTKTLVDLVNADVNMIVVPQLYSGSMDVLVDSAAAYRNLRYMIDPQGQACGFEERRLQGFYDAKNYPLSGWDGFLYTNRRL